MIDTTTICEHCGQTIYTTSSLNKGVIQMLSAMFNFVGQKGINVFHPEKELLQQGYISANMRGNVSHLGNHGLIAHVKGESGNWLLTSKAAKFMRGERINKVAIVCKKTKHTIGYTDETVSYGELLTNTDDYWYQPKFTIQEGRIIKDIGTPDGQLFDTNKYNRHEY